MPKKKKKVEDLQWYVYRYNINADKIEPFNIFCHWKLCEDLEKSRKKYKTRDKFVEQLRRELKYYFWSRSEYELIVQFTKDDHVYLTPWCGCRKPEEAQIEVTNELGIDWQLFAASHVIKQTYGNKAKIDIYEQVMCNWNEFCNYVCRELGVE